MPDPASALQTIDLYCERTDPGLLAEPFNVVTNIAFFIAAWGGWRLGRRLNVLSSGFWLLIALLAAIGIGSALFHTFATDWAMRLDVVPILLFQLGYLWLYACRVARLRAGAALGSVTILYASAHLAEQFPDVLNGSLAYMPGLALLVVLGLYHFRRQKAGRSLLLAAAGLFTLALFLRTIDNAVCALFPIGTHFLWHLLNGVVLYLTLRALSLDRAGSPGKVQEAG